MPEPGRSLVRKVARPYPPYLGTSTGMMVMMKMTMMIDEYDKYDDDDMMMMMMSKMIDD